MTAYRFSIQGKPVAPGAQITDFRGDPHQFVGVYHPRKIVVCDVGADPTSPSGQCERYPSVFDGEIHEQHGPNGTWTRTAF